MASGITAHFQILASYMNVFKTGFKPCHLQALDASCLSISIRCIVNHFWQSYEGVDIASRVTLI
jgi:hypothetical protein